MENKEKSGKSKRDKQKRKYSKLGCLAWALRNLWKIEPRFLFLVGASVPVAVILPLVEAYFPKALLDAMSSTDAMTSGNAIEGNAIAGNALVGNTLASRLFGISAGFIAVITLLGLLKEWLGDRCNARRYYPTVLYQVKMSELRKYETDFENTEKEEFKRISNYAMEEACHGDSSVEFLWQDVMQMLIHFFGIAAYASFLAVLHPVIFAVVAAVSVASYFTTRLQPRYYEKNKHRWEKEDRKKNYLQNLSEDFPRAKDIKLYGLTGWLDQMMQDYQGYIQMWNRRCSLRGLLASVFSALMSLLQNGTAYAVLIGMLFSGSITVGEFVFYFGLVGGLAGFLQGIIGDVAKLSTRADKISYYRELFDYPNRLNHGEGCALPAFPVTIELKDVWYRYDGAKEDTLKGINLTIRAGEKLALVGVNGAGKTTLAKLICGFYLPTRGEILVGGRKIEEYNIKEYYSIISAVFQEVRAVAFTIFEYVASADLERESAREDAIAAMEAAGIYEKVKSLPNGMETHLMKGIYDDGVDFSGGEMQKLVLARAIYKNGGILILDEPTAALDPIAENELYLKYNELTAGKTSIYISHRFASTRFCDRIILLADGKVKESGNHEELMQKNGEYAYMFGVQSKYYKEGSHE